MKAKFRWRLVFIVLMNCLAVFAQSKSEPSSDMGKLRFLFGEWAYVDERPIAHCTFSFSPELNGKVVVHHNHADQKGCPPEMRGLMENFTIFYTEPSDLKIHAVYMDANGNVLHFAVSFPAKDRVVLESDGLAGGTRTRISYSLDNAVLHTTCQTASQDKDYRTYLEFLSPRAVVSQ